MQEYQSIVAKVLETLGRAIACAACHTGRQRDQEIPHFGLQRAQTSTDGS